MSLLDPIREWFFTRALKKAVVVVAQAVASYAVAHTVSVGISIDPDKLAAALLAGSEIVRSYVKQKFGISWL